MNQRRLKIILMLSLLCLIASVPARSADANPFPLVYHSCQGEGCGCAKSPVVQHDTPLYADMTLSSKIVGVLKQGQKASVFESETIVRKPGRATVTNIGSGGSGLKVGDEIQLILYKGEGAWLVWNKGKELELNESEVSLKITERPKTESWFKLGNDHIQGYSQDFPFEGCLE